jgi:hypothetical protein
VNKHKENITSKRKRILKLFLKTILWIIAIPVSLLIILILLLQIPSVQRFVTSQTTSFLSGKIHAKVELKKLSIVFPKSIALEDLYVEDLSKDTLLYAHHLQVDIDLLDLLDKKITVNHVELNKITGHLSRPATTEDFNFNFIVEAFSKPGKEETPAQPKDTTKAAWAFSIKTVELHSIYFTYHDAYTGTFADLKLGDFETDVKTLDLANKKIAVNTVSLKNTNLNFTQKSSHKKPEPKTPAKPFDYDISLGKLELAGINAIYNNTINNQQAALALGELILKPKKFDMLHERIELESLLLSNTTAKYIIGKDVSPQKPAGDTEDTTKGSIPNWIVTLNQLDLNDNHFYFDNNRASKTKSGVDYNHIFADNFNLHATDVYGSAKASHLKMQQLSFKEQCGFELKKFTGDLVYDTTHIDASRLLIETNHSIIKDHLAIRYASIQDIGKDVGNLYTSAQLKNSFVTMSDVLYFAPMLMDIKAMNWSPKTSVKLSMDAKGTINNLHIDEFTLFTPKNTIIKLKGSLKQVLDPNKMFLDVRDINMTSTRSDLFSIISPSLIPKTVTLPETFAVSGNVTGYMKNFNTTLNLQTSMGNVLADIRMNPKAGNIEQPYEGTVKAEHFNVGKLINQTAILGEVTTILHVKGSGLSTKTINAEINLDLQKASVKGYEYTNLKVDGQLIKKSFTGKAIMNDQNLAFDFDGSLNFDSAAPKYVFTMDLKGADLKALHLSTEDARLKTFIKSDLTQQGDNITGAARIYNTLLIKNKKRYPVDSIILTSTYKDGVSDIKLQSGIVEAGLYGTLHMNELGASFKQFIAHYYASPTARATTQNLKPQKFDYHINVIDPTLIVENAIPGLEEMSPVFISGSYSSTEQKLVTNLSVPNVKYSGTKADSIKLNINSDPTVLNYALTTAEVSNPTIKFENMSLRGDVKNNVIDFQLATAKDDSIKLLALGGTLKAINEGHELKLNPDLTLNAQKWTVDQNNYLNFLPKGIIANELNISNANQAITVNSKSKEPGAPLDLAFKHFDLSTISNILENKKELVKGEMNGTVTLEKKDSVSAFSSDLVITDLVFQAVPIGTVKLKADNKQNSNLYDINLDIEGSGNDINVNGKYNVASKENALNFLLDIKTLNMKTIEPFTFGQVTRMSGTVNGKLAVKGGIETPDLNGKLHFKESALNPQFLDTYLKIPDGNLSFDNKKLIFQNFTIIDSLDNKAVLNGNVDIRDLKDPKLDLRLKSDNFLALNTTKKDNPLYFGTIFLDSDISVRGSLNAPEIKAKARLNKGSEITYVKPETEVGKEENKGIIEFVDSLNTDKAIMTRQNDTSKQVTMMKGIDLDASITFDKTVLLKMLVDQSSGDSLYIVGGGTLNFMLDKSGKTTLVGKYRIDDGGYHLSISEVVKRDFRIEPGSSVSWSGDLLDAYVDIKAIYTIKTSPIDLIQNDLAGVDELERNKYRNMLTFLVYLKMNGFLSAPEISFDIQLAPKDKGAVNGTVNSKLEELRADETQLNKQVFALLTLRRFISDNPLDNGGGGGGLSSASRTSASKVLTQQLSSLSQKYIKGVDLDLGVNSFEDYSTGQEQGRTQLQIGVSKQLFKDKVTIRVGGNVELEGERAKQNNASDVAGNINIDYKLTEDGRYKLRGFRQNQYENPIEGEITKTGVGVVYVRNYNRLKELFRKPKQTKKPTEGKTK